MQYCIAHERNYAEKFEKYQVAYQQACSYTVKYEAYGGGSIKRQSGKTKVSGILVLLLTYFGRVLTPIEKYENYLQVHKNCQKVTSTGRKDFYFYNCLLDEEQFTQQLPVYSLYSKVLICKLLRGSGSKCLNGEGGIRAADTIT